MLTVILKPEMGLSPPIMNDLLVLGQNGYYKLKSGVWNIRKIKFGFETISTITAILCGNLPDDIKIQIV